MTQNAPLPPQFFLTSPSVCPYLPGRQARKVFTHLIGRRAEELNTVLTHAGFRRSQTISYRPACENCRACISVRVPVRDFVPGRNMRRVMKANADLVSERRPNRALSEHYSLFRDYIMARHGDGGMAAMSMLDFSMMVEESHIETMLVEYRRRGPDSAINGRGTGPLLACALTDVFPDGLSMVYSFFDPAQGSRSLGTLMILDHIALAKAMRLDYLYLGYWVEGSPQMDYKARFLPQERLGKDGWVRVE